MAWSAPKTWVDQETPSAEDFNTQIRDNLNALSTHTHTGAAGDGSATLNSVDYIDLDEGGSLSTPASGHTRFAANNDGTLRYFAEGSTEKTVSDTTHTHTIASSTETKTNTESLSSVGTTYEDSVSHSFTPSDSTGTSHFVTVQFASATFVNASGTGGTVYMRILKAGSQIQETSGTLADPATSLKTLSQSYVHSQPAASSTTWAQEVKIASGVGGTNAGYKSLITRQVRCQ
jgi:hypothetical protein